MKKVVNIEDKAREIYIQNKSLYDICFDLEQAVEQLEESIAKLQSDTSQLYIDKTNHGRS